MTGQSELTQYLCKQKEKKGYLFIPYVAVGDPDFDTSFQIVDALINLGADSLELGLPFTDPVADGPVLQRAFERILNNGYQVEQYFSFLKKLHQTYPNYQWVSMGYSNIVLKKGIKPFCDRLAETGGSGLVIPDIPSEEIDVLWSENQVSAKQVAPIKFITPLTSPSRIPKIVQNADGFLYLVSVKGITGQAGFNLNPLKGLIRTVKEQTEIPLVTGFGIREKSHAMQAARLTDGFIVGSLIHEVIEKNLAHPKKIVSQLQRTISGILP